MPTDTVRVTDDAGVDFELGPKIASGGQGAVHRVVGHPGYAIKLLRDPKDLERIAAVRRLPLDGLAVAAPVTLIRTGGHGYLMRLASDMTPIREPYLPREFGPRESRASWYAETGGLRRRLAIAANVAHTIAALHERGLAYVDLNPGNVMVSDAIERTETWLIDTDNLTSRSTPVSQILGFPGYLAPERKVRSAPASTLADTYILGIHVFRMLVLRHPLEGVTADELDGQTAVDMLDRGALPYVGDRDDASNALPGFPAAIFDAVMTTRLRALCEATFVAGRLDPIRRPGASRWRDVLWSALDNVVDCARGCGWSYYRLRPSCPSCGGATPASVLITTSPLVDGHRLPARDSLVAHPGAETPVLPRHLWGRHDDREPVVTFRPTRGGFEVTAHDPVRVTDGHGRDVRNIPRPVDGALYRMRVDAPGRPTRVLAVRSVSPA